MARSIKTWTCKNCGKEFHRVNTGHSYKFCSRSCSTKFNRPSDALIIQDESKMSRRTKFRRRAAKGLTQPVFRYYWDDTIFDNWSDEKAWLMGLIWSDGNLYRNTIEICSKDADLMGLVEGLIGMENGIRVKNNGSHFRIVFTSKRVADYLRSKGLIERKSLTIDFPTIPDAFVGGFLRGILDGDGSVYSRNTRPGQQVSDLIVVFYTGSAVFKDGLIAKLTEFNIDATENKTRTVWRISVRKHDSIRRLHNLMYPSEDVSCLVRKRAPYEVWMETPRARPGRPKK